EHSAGGFGNHQISPVATYIPPNKVQREDHDNSLPSFSSLLATDCPMSRLDPQFLVPCPGLPHPHRLAIAPVLALRVVFVDGGVILVMSTHHNMIDGAGSMQLWDYLATIMKGEAISAEALSRSNTDRSRVLPLLRADEAVNDYSYLLRPSPWPLGAPPATSWCVFLTTRSALADIKKRSSVFIEETKTDVDYVSSDDALAAFCWQRISAIRLQGRRCRPGQMSKFGRAVDGRPAVGLSSNYLGHMVVHAVTCLPVGEVATRPLCSLAGMLRHDLQEARTEWSVRSCATFISRVKDKSMLLYGGLYKPETDLCSSSLLKMSTNEPFKMGMLGESKFFRKPDGPSIPVCIYFFPSDNRDKVQVVLCVTDHDLQGLEGDKEWGYYMQRVG
ncbi:hypothetical protein F5Y15DRAFT_428114, partial [Xylariaceae sp. FL0016]